MYFSHVKMTHINLIYRSNTISYKSDVYEISFLKKGRMLAQKKKKKKKTF
jgi:hypothetical protein